MRTFQQFNDYMSLNDLKRVKYLPCGYLLQYSFRFVQADLTENNVLLYFLSVLEFELQILLIDPQVYYQPSKSPL